MVVITPEQVNAFYGLPDLEWPNGIPYLPALHTTGSMAEALRMDGSQEWSREHPLKHGEMHFEAAFWSVIVSYSVRPSGHYSTLAVKKAPAVYCLWQRERIDLGKVICREIKEASGVDGAHQVLPFPGLISYFCSAAGLDVFSDPSKVHRPFSALGAESYNRIIGKRGGIEKLPTRASMRLAQTAEPRPIGEAEGLGGADSDASNWSVPEQRAQQDIPSSSRATPTDMPPWVQQLMDSHQRLVTESAAMRETLQAVQQGQENVINGVSGEVYRLTAYQHRMDDRIQASFAALQEKQEEFQRGLRADIDRIHARQDNIESQGQVIRQQLKEFARAINEYHTYGVVKRPV